ncbi:MAG: hypothetical protein ACLFVJ_20525 [Persicimonas sp.]
MADEKTGIHAWQTSPPLGDALGVSAAYIRTLADTGQSYDGYTIESREVEEGDDVHHSTKHLYRAVGEGSEPKPASPESVAEDEPASAEPESREDLLAELAGAEARIDELEAALEAETVGADALLLKEDETEERIEKLEAEVERQREMREAVKAERDELQALLGRVQSITQVSENEAAIDYIEDWADRLDTQAKEIAGLKGQRAALKEKSDKRRHKLESIDEVVNNHPLGKLVIESHRARHDLPQWVETFLDVAHERIKDLEINQAPDIPWPPEKIAALRDERDAARKRVEELEAELRRAHDRPAALTDALVDAAWDLVTARAITASDSAGLLEALGQALREHYEGTA